MTTTIDSFDDLLVKVLPRAYAFALTLCWDATRAEDLVQGAALRALENYDKFEMGTNFDAWFFTILKNSFLTELRRKRREVEDPDDAFARQAVAVDDPHVELEVRQFLEEVEVRLSPLMCEALMSAGLGESYDETSRRLGVPVGTVKSRLHRARVMMEDHD